MDRIRPYGPLLLAALVGVFTPASADERDVGRVAVPAVAETEPVTHDGDAADDPAIWVHPTAPSRSTIIGTDKRGGLTVYDLSGRRIQRVSRDEFNNVDVRYGFPLRGSRSDIVVAGNRTRRELTVFRVGPSTGKLVRVAGVPVDFTPVGTCLYHSRRLDEFFVFVTSHDGPVQQWRLREGLREGIEATLVRSFRTRWYPPESLAVKGFSASEGCVADDENGFLYLAEEDVALWRYPADPDAEGAKRIVQPVGENLRLVPDIEGVALYRGPDGTGYIIVSNQMRDEFVIFRREGDNDYVGTFTIRDGARTDGVLHTDGIDAVSGDLGPEFRFGLFVAQDDDNGTDNQNFKLVDWRDIADRFSPPLLRAR